MYFQYIRVSDNDQNEDRQLEALKKYCDSEKIHVEQNNIFIDKKSGKNFDRPNYIKMKNSLRKNDVVIIYELDRLGRDKQMIKEELMYYRDKSIRVIILDIPTTRMDLSAMEDGVAKAMLDMINNVLIEVLATISEEERKKIRKRQAEGIAIAKAKGVYTGRKSITREDLPKNFSKLYKQWSNNEISATQFAKLIDVKSRTTLYKYIGIYKQ
ncbi:recombinase family protein [Clostridium butyricum]|uniref:recombinase family protein n=1 Tax=Clostridium butyricum TaxID=1492 RepID=UPI000903150A|nr:recombinase family protein [Clostridium butyricum]APF24744.1 hypothetical protein NPD4_3274 [Clostridium butyricum]